MALWPFDRSSIFLNSRLPVPVWTSNCTSTACPTDCSSSSRKSGSPASRTARACAPVTENCALSSDSPARAASTKARVEKLSSSIAAMIRLR